MSEELSIELQGVRKEVRQIREDFQQIRGMLVNKALDEPTKKKLKVKLGTGQKLPGYPFYINLTCVEFQWTKFSVDENFRQ